jgi:hypothetical protein
VRAFYAYSIWQRILSILSVYENRCLSSKLNTPYDGKLRGNRGNSRDNGEMGRVNTPYDVATPSPQVWLGTPVGHFDIDADSSEESAYVYANA